jgi:hypothetical protein
VNAPQISCLNLTSLFALFVFLLGRQASGAFTIDSSIPTLRIIKNEHWIEVIGTILQKKKNGVNQDKN